MMINPFTLRILTGIVNRYIKLDPESEIRLKPLAGQVLCVDLQGVNKKLFFIFRDSDLVIKARYTDVPEATIMATPLALARFFANKKPRLLEDDITMTGKVRFAQDVQKLFEAINIDWEEKLATLTGDVAAHHIGRAAREARDLAKKTKNTFKKNVTEYLQEEAKLTPPKFEVNDFCEDVDQLRMNVDRLSARVSALEKRFSRQKV